MSPTVLIILLLAVSVVGAVIAGLAISKAMGRSAESRQVSDRLRREGYVGVAFVRDRKPGVAFEPMQSPDAQEALARYNARRGLTG